jgi:polyether ionophore transport system permease protein
VSATKAIAWRAFVDARGRTFSFAALLLFIAAANVVGYRRSYPTITERLAFARSFGSNKAVELFYGSPHDLLTVGGYAAWRVGGAGAIIAGLCGLLAAVRALRGEEDAGRQELVLAGSVSRRAAYLGALAAIGAVAATLWLSLFVGLAGARLPLGPAAFLAFATVSPFVVFAGFGSLACQLAPSRRIAIELATGSLVIAYLLRVIGDLSSSLGWIRWVTPLGWSEEARAFAGARPVVLGLPILGGAVLLAVAGVLSVRRDVGTGLLPARDSADPRFRLLSSPTALAARGELGSVGVWTAGIGLFAAVVGLLSTSFTNANIPVNLREQLQKLGGATITTPSGALGFYFLLFVLAISLFACSQIAALRRDEAEQRLETLLAFPVGRHRFLASRLVLAAAATMLLALVAGLAAWVGAAAQDAHVPLLRMLEAGANCLPVALLFLALGAFAFALVPRAAGGIAYGLVSIAFVWELLGSLLGAPHWLVELSPFQHIALVPAEAFRAGAAVTLLALAAIVALASLWTFGRRDLTGA